MSDEPKRGGEGGFFLNRLQRNKEKYFGLDPAEGECPPG